MGFVQSAPVNIDQLNLSLNTSLKFYAIFVH